MRNSSWLNAKLFLTLPETVRAFEPERLADVNAPNPIPPLVNMTLFHRDGQAWEASVCFECYCAAIGDAGMVVSASTAKNAAECGAV